MIQQCPRCERIVSDGACSVHPTATLEAAMIGRYRLWHSLGEGGFGEVFAGRHVDLDRPAAIKILQSTSDTAMARFRQEGQALWALSREAPHAHLVQVYDMNLEGRVPWMAMQLIDGTTLAAHIKHGPRPISEACALFAQAADALEHIHRAGWVHRDIKPGNIMIERLSSGLNARLVDLGIARPLRHALALTDGHAPHTPAYAGPEWGEADALLGPAYDVYSLGVCLYQTISGVNPYLAGSWVECLDRHRKGLSKRLADAVEGVEPTLDNLVSRMLATDPAARPTAAQVRDALRPAVAVAPTLDETVEPPPRASARAPWPLLAVVALVAVITLLALKPAPSVQDAALPPLDAAVPDAAPPDVAPQPVVVELKVPGGGVVLTHLIRTGTKGLRLQKDLRSPMVPVRKVVDGERKLGPLGVNAGVTLISCGGRPMATGDDLIDCVSRPFRGASTAKNGAEVELVTSLGVLLLDLPGPL